MRVLVCGSRNWSHYYVMERRLKLILPPVVIIEGEAKGADIMARRIAERLGYQVERFPAEWEIYSNRAGAIRNQQMLDKGKPDLVLAYPMPDSVGTYDMIARARRAGIPVEVVTGVV